MAKDKHVVEAPERFAVDFATGSTDRPLIVLNSDLFGWDDDLPSTNDRVTVVIGDRVIRGFVTDTAFVVREQPDDA